MKIIHIAGWSGSGKTTFILNLVKALSSQGKVGCVKHIGDHICELSSGKDTTRHYEAGACITAGIDLEKTMITCRSVSLPASLDILADTGVQFAVVEGFKDVPFKKVVFGDLNKPALIRNPTVGEVISILAEFDDYYTLSGLIRELEGELNGVLLYSMTGNYSHDSDIADDCIQLEEEISRWTSVSGVRVRVNPAILNKSCRIFAVIWAGDPQTGTRALSRCGEVFWRNNCNNIGSRTEGGHPDSPC